MRYYPVNLDIRGRRCLVVGGGAVGSRKVQTLLRCGARVTVVSRETTPSLQELAAQGRITLVQKSYQNSDLNGMFLVIGATNDESLNQKISQDAEQRNLLCNIVDRPKVCNFILPSIVERGDLIITVSTSGKSPALAKKLRQALEKEFGEEYGQLLLIMGAIRAKLLSGPHAPEMHAALFERLVNSELLELIRIGDTDRINALLEESLGAGYGLNDLINTNESNH
jgi:precorrin-2 dehydrogenase/sirohydrochlorin ferrochelatase